MKKLIFAAACLVIIPPITYFDASQLWKWRDRWTVEPASDGKWRSCLYEHGSKSCGSPISYDEAAWWSETKAGTVIR